MRYFLILITAAFLLTKDVFAQTYFDFSTPLMTSFDGYINSSLKFYFEDKIKEDRFSVRPVADKGSIRIYNTKYDLWVGNEEPWTYMPDLSKEIKLLVHPLGNKKISLNFEIMDKITYQIYKTSSHTFWTYYSYNNYLNRLNENILK